MIILLLLINLINIFINIKHNECFSCIDERIQRKIQI